MGITVRDAYRKGRRSGGTQVDPDEALERFSRRYCQHPPSWRQLCELEHAWWNGFNDAPYGTAHSLHCPLGVAYALGHGDCDRSKEEL